MNEETQEIFEDAVFEGVPIKIMKTTPDKNVGVVSLSINRKAKENVF